MMRLHRKGAFILCSLIVLVGTVSYLGQNSLRERQMKADLLENAIFSPDTTKPTSYDPLDADFSPNLWVMRMINLTPLEVSVSNRLTSQLLSDFSYIPEQARINFKLRTGIVFSDGTPISADDVAFAIARMAYSRPRFPVLSEIQGLEEWLEQPDALLRYPTGIQVAADTVTIQLRRNVDNPLFRFVLEIFSVVPRSAIDPLTNKLKVPRPPTSGNYTIAHESERALVFTLRMSPFQGHQIHAPRKITFQYTGGDPDYGNLKEFPPTLIRSGIEFSLRTKRVNLESFGLHVTWTPASSYGIMILNPAVGPLRDPGCRQLFAQTFRDEVGNMLGDRTGVEASLFPLVVPGYLAPNRLHPSFNEQECLTRLGSESIPYTPYPKGRNVFYDEAVRRTAARLGTKLDERAALESWADHERAYFAGASAFLFGSSGFWPLDPVGDIRMLFAPNMHGFLRHVWSDAKLRSMLDRLGDSENSGEIKSQLEAINTLVFEQAVFNPIAHFRRYFVSSNKLALREVPLAVQQPYAWQAFNVD